MKNKPIRLKLTDALGNTTYLVVRDQRVQLTSESGIPLALSNLFGNKAEEVRFALEDVNTARGALDYVKANVDRNVQVNLI